MFEEGFKLIESQDDRMITYQQPLPSDYIFKETNYVHILYLIIPLEHFKYDSIV